MAKQVFPLDIKEFDGKIAAERTRSIQREIKSSDGSVLPITLVLDASSSVKCVPFSAEADAPESVPVVSGDKGDESK